MPKDRRQQLFAIIYAKYELSCYISRRLMIIFLVDTKQNRITEQCLKFDIRNNDVEERLV